jgi:hypothetical protein
MTYHNPSQKWCKKVLVCEVFNMHMLEYVVAYSSIS